MKKRSLNILLLPKERYPNNRPMLIELWNNEFSKRGHSLTWIMQSFNPQKKIEKKRWNDSILYLTPSTKRESLFNKFLNKKYNCYFKFKVCRKIIKNHNFDCIHSHGGAIEGIIGLYFARKYDVLFSFAYTAPFIEIRKNSLEKKFSFEQILKTFEYLIYKKLYKIILKNSGLIFPISDSLGNVIIDTFHIDPKKIFPLSECGTRLFLNFLDTNQNTNSNNVIIYTGSLGKSRNLKFLLRVFKLVLEKEKEAILVFLGWGEKPDDIPDLKKYCEKLNISNSIKFIGKIPYEDVPKIVSKSKVGVSPIPPKNIYLISTPTKTLEYLSLSIPTVANKEIYDQKEILEKSGGGFAVKYNEKEFANAIIWLLEHPEKAKIMGEKGREWIKINRNYEKLAEELEKKYYNILMES